MGFRSRTVSSPVLRRQTDLHSPSGSSRNSKPDPLLFVRARCCFPLETLPKTGDCVCARVDANTSPSASMRGRAGKADARINSCQRHTRYRKVTDRSIKPALLPSCTANDDRLHGPSSVTGCSFFACFCASMQTLSPLLCRSNALLPSDSIVTSGKKSN